MISKAKIANLMMISMVAIGAVDARAAMVEIKIQNLTVGQVFSPAAIVVHKPTFELFKVGESAQAAVYMVAEDGVTDAAKALESRLDVDSVTVASPVMPGKTISVRVAVPK
ncbi:MAG: spondin domain-containing protein, partial [Bdellovibrionota bacterium]